ncbi:MAG: helix-hairpin-helix domain-containing protein [Flavobacteriaceae bacterium]|nr:helix-hairpin-helix domain-containing protein [Flavobacteriaceae bacterium]
MTEKRSHFRFSKSQKSGVFFLLLIIIGIQIAYIYVDFGTAEVAIPQSTEVKMFLQEMDSLKGISQTKKSVKIFPFNPSFLSDYKGGLLGMSTEEINRILKHRERGKYINSSREFQQVSGVRDDLLATLKPYFKFPAWVTNKQGVTHRNKGRKALVGVRELNTASYQELMRVDGVSEALAKRIVNYRKRLFKYSVNEQLYEVWYLKKPLADKILKHFKVLVAVPLKKVNVNTASFKEILKIVYIDYELTKKIMNYRDEIAEYQSLEELKNIPGFPIDKFNRIILYLEAK